VIRFFLIYTYFFIIAILGKILNNDSIVWSKDSKLIWSYFKGIPDNKDSVDARSSLSIHYFYARHDDSLKIITKSVFDCTKSWVKLNDTTVVLLAHEKGHFDIEEIYRRRLNKELGKILLSKAEYKKEFQIIFNKICDECSNKQDQYDVETKHSQILLRQREWAKKISKELIELEQYDLNSITVGLKS
jgi:hypothetical protein